VGDRSTLLCRPDLRVTIRNFFIAVWAGRVRAFQPYDQTNLITRRAITYIRIDPAWWVGGRDGADKAEQLLGTRRFLCGAALTECDVRLFVTLIRFDAVYVVYFKCARKAIREFSNLFNFTKDVFQQPGVAGTVDMQHIVRPS
jgi:hypothetical protein